MTATQRPLSRLPRPAILGLGLWLLAITPAWSGPPDAAQVGTLEQQSLPALGARRAAALARVSAAKAFFAGRGAWERAFPELIDAPLGDPEQLRVQAERVRQRALARATERVVGAPDGLSASDTRRWTAALDAACLAEDDADTQLNRFLAGLAAGVEIAPGLAHASVERRLTRLASASVLPDPPNEAEAAVALAAADEADLLRAWRRAAWLAMTRPGDAALSMLAGAALDALPDLDVDAGPLMRIRVVGLQDRLHRVAPLLDPGEQQRAANFVAASDQALYAHATPAGEEAPPSASPRPVAEVKADIEVLEATARSAATELAEVQSDPASSPGAIAAAQALADQAGRSLSDLHAELAAAIALRTSGVSLDRTTADVDAALRLAGEARQRAADAENQGEQEIRRATAELRETSAQEIGAEQERRTAALTEIVDWRNALDAARTELAVAVALASLDPERQPRIDAAYLRLREVASTLRVAAGKKATRVSALQDLPDLDMTADAGSASPLVTERDAAMADLRQERAARTDIAVEEQDATVELLITAKSARRLARASAGRVARLVGQRAFIPELAEELDETRLVAGARLRDLVRDVRSLPSLALDLSALLAMVTGTLKLLVAAVLWWLLRSSISGRVEGMLERLQRARTTDEDRWAAVARELRERLERGDLRRLAPPLSAFLAGLLDMIALVALLYLVGDSLALVRLGVGILGAWVSWRTWPHALELLLVPSDAYRPAVLAVAKPTLVRAHRSLKLFLVWRLGTRVLDLFLFDLLAADRLTQLLDAISLGVGGVLALLLLWLWAPQIQEAAAQAEPTAMSRWAGAPASAVSRVPRAAVGLVALAWQFGWRGVSDLLSTRSNLRWIGAAMARQRLTTKKEPPVPLPEEVRDTLATLEPGPPPNLATVVDRVEKAHASWKAVPRRGVVAVLGDRGSGLDALPAALGASIDGAMVLRVPHRITRADDLMAWLSDALGHPGLDGAALADAMQADRGATIVLLDVHNLLLRAVGGFGALRALVELLQTTSEECFWICAFSAPTWKYLKGTPGAVDLGVFREVIRVGTVSGSELDKWLLPPLEAAELTPSFKGLASGSNASDDPRVALRARDAYFRLLEDISQGRPLVAHRLWSASQRGSATEGVVEHVAPSLPATDPMPDLEDDDLFLLTALAVHGQILVSDLAAVLNRPTAGIRAACRRMEALDIVCGDEAGESYDIDWLAHPQVLRVLRHRAFLETA